MSCLSRKWDETHVPIIAFSHTIWDGQWAGRQHTLSRLGKRGWPVLYSNGALYSHQCTNAQYFGYEEQKDDVRLYKPGKILPRNYKIPLADRWAVKHHCKKLKQILSIDHNDEFIVFCFNPSFFPYVQELNPTYVLYHMFDAYHFIGEVENQYHEQLVNIADLVTAVNNTVWDEMIKNPALERNIVENGVDISSFDNARQSSDISSQIEKIPGPRIGYLGTINRKLDYVLLNQLAQKFPDCHFVFIGRVMDNSIKSDEQKWMSYQEFFQRDNVTYAGQITKEHIPFCLDLMDIQIAPYLGTKESWMFAAYPLKINEYLASGKPVVSAYTAPIKQYFEGYIDICQTAEEWVDAIQRNLDGTSASTREERIMYARQNDWENRVDKFEQYIHTLIEHKSACCS
ncbi:glycosyltransferase [Nitrospira sp. M1]